MRDFFIRLRPLVLASVAAILLPSCFSPIKPLPQGTKVHFYNAIPSTVVVRETGIKHLLAPAADSHEVPELSAMMRRVVMEEAAKAGVTCQYTAVPAIKPSLFAVGHNLTELEALGVKVGGGVTLFATRGGNVSSSPYGGNSSFGFTVEHNKPLIPALTTVDLRGATVVARYDNPELSKTKATGVGLGGFGWMWHYRGFEGKRDWVTALPSSRANAIKGWEAFFREAVAQAFGNPFPKLTSPTEAKTL
jgi:hypothetical protein